MSFLFQTKDPLCGGRVVLRIWNTRPSDCMENPGSGVPYRDRSSPASTLVPGSVNQGLLGDNSFPAPTMPSQEDILTCSHRLGRATGLASPATC
jgi:hypothetical protein